MTRFLSHFLLAVFCTSVGLFPLIETVHAVLHTIDNPFHSHQVKPHHYHTIAEHNLKLGKPSTSFAGAETTHNFIALLFGIFCESPTHDYLVNGDNTQHNTKLLLLWTHHEFKPLTPPPL